MFSRKRELPADRDDEAPTERHAATTLNIVPARNSGAANAPVLEARGITKQYGGLMAVSDVTFSLAEGELRGVIGPNGAGTSTFFAMLAGELGIGRASCRERVGQYV